LFAAILLKRQGHNVRVLERVTSSARSGLAAGIGLGGWVKRFFDENDQLKEIPLGVPNDFLNVLDMDLNTKRQMPLNYRMTTWDATYYRLRANFDGFKSSYCPNPPAMDPDGGESYFETGRNVLRVEEGERNLLRVLAEDVETKEQLAYEVDAVIAADGANSTIRWQLQPDLRRQEPGYVLWRGTVPNRELSQEILDKLDGRTTQCPMKHSYTIM
jgi:2-polyprenyl-6-methoxyphenol hydroxylase-like FAD-dependent oxidoreductase